MPELIFATGIESSYPTKLEACEHYRNHRRDFELVAELGLHRHYTPVNEMYVAARNSALLGLWNEQLRDETAFVRATVHLARATILVMRAIREVVPNAVFIHSESSELFQASCPAPEIRRITSLENHRRFLGLDLLFAHPLDDDVRVLATSHSMTKAE